MTQVYDDEPELPLQEPNAQIHTDDRQRVETGAQHKPEAVSSEPATGTPDDPQATWRHLRELNATQEDAIQRLRELNASQAAAIQRLHARNATQADRIQHLQGQIYHARAGLIALAEGPWWRRSYARILAEERALARAGHDDDDGFAERVISAIRLAK